MKQLKWIVVILAVVLVLLLGMVVVLEMMKTTPQGQQDAPSTETQESSGVMTWEKYQALSLEEQDAFFQQFESVELFEKWLESVRPTETTVEIPSWDPSAKKPDTYTWEEYEALSREEQDAFYLWFDSVAAFEKWMDSVKPTEATVPDTTENKPSQPNQPTKPNNPGKQPNQYTWEEYQKMSPAEQEAFFQSFGSVEAFEKWMDSVKPAETTPQDPVWNKPGKKPDEYTWAEFEALSREEQDAFYLWFDSKDAFEAWMENAKPAETTPSDPVWDKPGKKPNEYTWEEYQALSQKDQDAFFHWFDSTAAFESWMESVKPKESTTPNTDWNKPGKKPNEYTWEEYQALTPQEQDAFFLWFGSVEAFETWMDSVK